MRESILELMKLALAGAENLPANRRADLYDAAATLLANAPAEFRLAQAWNAATRAADALRTAEGCQLTFSALLNQTTAQRS